MGFDREYLVFALAYVVVGMGLGLYMGASQNHGQLVTHAHPLLVGFVVSFIYAIIHKLWLPAPGRGLAHAQLVLHQLGALVMCAALFGMFAGFGSEDSLGPVLGIASAAVLAGAVLMVVLVAKSRNALA